MLLLGFIYTFKVFDLIYVMTGGGPVNATEVLPIYVYDTFFEFFRFGSGAAASVLVLVIPSSWPSSTWACCGERRPPDGRLPSRGRAASTANGPWRDRGWPYLFPVYWMIATSLKSFKDIFAVPPQLVPLPPVIPPTSTPLSATRMC